MKNDPYGIYKYKEKKMQSEHIKLEILAELKRMGDSLSSIDEKTDEDIA